MGIGFCEKHDYCTFISSCEHINAFVNKKYEGNIRATDLDSVTIVENFITRVLGFQKKYAYCSDCAKK